MWSICIESSIMMFIWYLSRGYGYLTISNHEIDVIIVVDVLPARFNGSQYLRLTNLTPNQSLTEQFVIKFKTRLSTGVILTTQTSISDDVVSVFMYQSKLIVRYLLSGYQQVSRYYCVYLSSLNIYMTERWYSRIAVVFSSLYAMSKGYHTTRHVFVPALHCQLHTHYTMLF